MNIPKSVVPKKSVTDSEINRCFDVVSELRPHLERESFLKTVREMQTDGYQLAFIEDDNHVVAVAGYRIYSIYLWVNICKSMIWLRQRKQDQKVMANV